MKVLIGAGAALFMFAAIASAQTPTPAPEPAANPNVQVAASQCPTPPPNPTIPDGAVADGAQMEVANTVYMAWATTMQQITVCRRNEYETALATARVRRDEHNAIAEQLNTVTQSWTAESTEYCARPRMSCSTQ
ncbi:MAG: hypothetical protein WDM79_13410 [Terricaulis sp.]